MSGQMNRPDCQKAELTPILIRYGKRPRFNGIALVFYNWTAAHGLYHRRCLNLQWLGKDHSCRCLTMYCLQRDEAKAGFCRSAGEWRSTMAGCRDSAPALPGNATALVRTHPEIMRQS